MAEQKQRIPIFARGTIDQLEKALTTGIFASLDRIIWFYVTEGENAGSLILVYADKTLHYINDTQLATTVAELGERINANTDNIATLDEGLQAATDALNNYATWAETVDSTLTTLRNDLDFLEARMDAAGETISNMSTRLTTAEETIATHSNAISDNTTAINANAETIAEHTATLASQNDTLDIINQSIAKLENKVNTEDLEGKTVSSFVTEQVNTVKDYVDQAFDWEPIG